jgi:peptide/nickel transport system substrate-binding protein
VLADELGLGDGGVTTALQTGDVPTIDRVAAAWNQTWNLTPDADLKKFPSSGPYKLDEVTDQGAVVLVANDKWWGAKPVTARITVWPRGADIQDRVNEGFYDVVDVAAGSTGTLTLPDEYERTDTSSAGIEQIIFAASGPLADPAARRAVALCTPRDVIARNAQVPVANNRLNAASEDSLNAAESGVEADQYNVANPVAARDAIGGRPLTVRLGYQSPNARLAAIVGTIAKSCAAAGITVQDAAGATVNPQALRDNQIDALLASTGGATGSGSTGSTGSSPRWR